MTALLKMIPAFLGAQLDHIDREFKGKEKVSGTSVVSVTLFSCLMLYLLNYVVLSYDIQVYLASKMHDLILSLGGPDFPEVLLMKATWSLGCFTVYLVLPGLYTRFVLKKRFSDLGFSPRGFFRHFPIYLFLLIPVLGCVFLVSFRPEFQRTYPFYHNPASLMHLAVWDALYAIQFLSLEFFFRGFMLVRWRELIGWRAVLVMVIPYCMIHFPKPALEAFGAIIAGSVLGILALRTRSIWGGIFIHVLVAWSMDLASLWQRKWF